MNEFVGEVFAIASRDWKKKGKIWKVVLITFLMGLIVFGIGQGFDRILSASFYAKSYSAFFSFGFLVYLVFLIGATNGSNIIIDRDSFIRLLLVAPVSKYSILFGKTLSTLTTSIRAFFFLGLFFLLLNKEFSVAKIFFVIFYCAFLVVTGVATGLFFSTLSKNKRTSEYVLGGFNFALLFLSGILFPVSSLPEKIQILFKINPLVYITDLFRFLMTGTAEFPIILDALVVLTFGVLIILLGVYQFDRNLRK